jgi:hypothetical protein
MIAIRHVIVAGVVLWAVLANAETCGFPLAARDALAARGFHVTRYSVPREHVEHAPKQSIFHVEHATRAGCEPLVSSEVEARATERPDAAATSRRVVWPRALCSRSCRARSLQHLRSITAALRNGPRQVRAGLGAVGM